MGLSKQVIDELPKVHVFLADQLRWAAASVVQSFAEGHDKGTRAEQRRYSRIARGSAQEVGPVLVLYNSARGLVV